MKSIEIIGFIIVLLMNNLLFGQDDVLFQYGSHQVTQSEFEYVFAKNNPEVENVSKQDLEDYLDLYIKFKLKVAAAVDMQVDTLPGVRNDLKVYLEQLFNSYVDKKIIDTLINEAYERMKYDLHLSHILVQVSPNAKPEDTLKAYTRIMNIRSEILGGRPFDKVAVELSDDKYVKQNKGDIGYISGLLIPFYNFETTAYNTPVGKLSMPVRTRLGYHLIKVMDKRKAMGTVQLKHILVKFPKNPAPSDIEKARKKADSLYNLIENGASFDAVATANSDDKLSASKGGLMEPFGSGSMVPVFEDRAYALEKDGDMSKPFQSNIGFHIIKRVSRTPLKPLDEIRDQLKRKIQQDERYQIARNRLIRQYKETHSFIQFNDRAEPLVTRLDSSILNASWKYVPKPADSVELFVIGNKSYYGVDLLRYIQKYQVRKRNGDFPELLDEYYRKFIERSVLEYGIEHEPGDYNMIKKEYYEGIVMFAAMEKMVWTKAVQDSAGLQAYYDAHKNDHKWGERMVVDVYRIKGYVKKKIQDTTSNPPKDTVIIVADSVYTMKLVNKAEKWIGKKIPDFIVSKLNKKNAGRDNVQYNRAKVLEDNSDASRKLWKTQPGRYVKTKFEDGTYEIMMMDRMIGPEPKLLSEARGAFISDYQNQLEKDWINELKGKYPVKINMDVLDKMAN
jgi:peptidyl-prolyl cis-trans isomerase SurA